MYAQWEITYPNTVRLKGGWTTEITTEGVHVTSYCTHYALSSQLYNNNEVHLPEKDFFGANYTQSAQAELHYVLHTGCY